MSTTTPSYLDEHSLEHRFDNANANYRTAAASAVSWGAIVAGAFVASLSATIGGHRRDA